MFVVVVVVVVPPVPMRMENSYTNLCRKKRTREKKQRLQIKKGTAKKYITKLQGVHEPTTTKYHDHDDDDDDDEQ